MNNRPRIGKEKFVGMFAALSCNGGNALILMRISSGIDYKMWQCSVTSRRTCSTVIVPEQFGIDCVHGTNTVLSDRCGFEIKFPSSPWPIC